MFGSASLFRLGGVVAAGAVVAAAAGCSSGGSSSAPPSSPASSASSASSSSAPSSPAPSSAPSSSAAPSGSQSPHAVAGSSPAQSAPAGPVGCATRDLQAKLANGQGAAGSLYQNIDFTNVGSTQCSLFGYPGVSIGTGMPFKQVGTAATRSTAASAAVVTLAPGQTANALLRVTQALNYPSAKCSPAKTTYLQVYPPNQTTAIYVAYSSTGCTSTSVNLLTIGVVQAGAGSQ
jgi:Protein of unknown function (DUF4232)